MNQKKEVYRFRSPNRISKKSQVSLFIILGIVVVIIIAFVIFMQTTLVKKETEGDVERVQEHSFNTMPVENYVSECLKRLLDQSLDFVGHQSGYIFEDPAWGRSVTGDLHWGGKTYFYENPLEYRYYTPNPEYPYQTPYTIFDPKAGYGDCSDPEYNDDTNAYFCNTPPLYPWRTFPFYKDEEGTERYKVPATFGSVVLPHLYKLTEECIDERKPPSVECQMESFIYKNLDGVNYDTTYLGGRDYCLYEDDFIDTLRTQGYDIEVLGEKNVEIKISENDVRAYLTYPIKIKELSSGKVETINNFYALSNVRLSKIYRFAKNLMTEDISNIEFDMGDYIQYEPLPTHELEFSVIVDTSIPGEDDLVMVEDTESRLYNEPYKFWFMRKNRRPALGYIKTLKINGVSKDITPAVKLQGSKVITIQKGDELKIDGLTALDPDEDTLTYHLSVYKYFSSPAVIKFNQDIGASWIKSFGDGPGQISPSIYILNLSVRDTTNLVDSNKLEDFQIIHLKVNSPPTINRIKKGATTINPITLIECTKGSTLTFSPDISDPDDYSAYIGNHKFNSLFEEGLDEDDKTELIYEWFNSCTGTTTNSHSLSYACPYSTSTCTLTLKVKDKSGAESNGYSFNVKAKNEPPQVRITQPSSNMEYYWLPGSEVEVSFIGTDSDDGTVVKRTWNFDDGPTCSTGESCCNDASKDCTRGLHKYKFPGQYFVRYICEDDQGAESYDSVTITLEEP